jgi:hypothetical protein
LHHAARTVLALNAVAPLRLNVVHDDTEVIPMLKIRAFQWAVRAAVIASFLLAASAGTKWH